MFELQFRWDGKWRPVSTFPSRDEAEAAAIDWRVAFGCSGNPFRIVKGSTHE